MPSPIEDALKDPSDEDKAKAIALIEQIEVLFMGTGAVIPGVVLCTLTATWLRGFLDEGMRERMHVMQFGAVRDAMRIMDGKKPEGEQ